MVKNNAIKFDVMLKDRYVCTMQMPLGLNQLIGYDGDMPVFNLSKSDVKKYVEQKRPSLKGKKYHIEFVTKTTKELWVK